MGLFNLFKKKPSPKIKVEMRGFVNGKEVRLKEEETPDEIKPMKYYETLQREVKPLEDIMVSFAVSSKDIKGVGNRIEILKALVESYYDLKSKCISLGPDYQDYFSKMWEHCHNSQNPDFSYIEQYEKELHELQENREELEAQEALHTKAAERLEERVLAVLKESPTILQTDLYRHFDPIVQKDIQSILFFMAKNGVITRKKSGKTYEIQYHN